MKKTEILLDAPGVPLDPLDRAARMADLSDRLGLCLEELDRMSLWDVGAHLSMAIDTLERHATSASPSRL